MVDIHCHILPGFDDGSPDIDESLAMARMAASSGVTAIVATPHFPGEAASLQRLDALVGKYGQLVRAVEQAGLPLKLYPGAEILCLPETPRLAARQALPTIGNTSYLLAEFYFNESAGYMSQMLDALAEAGYHPVVAHPERYRAVQLDPGLAEQWFLQGYILQLNKGSVLGAFGTRVQQTANRILDGGYAHLIASDAHGSVRRTPHIGALRQWMEGRVEPAYAQVLLERNPARLVEGRPMVPPDASAGL